MVGPPIEPKHYRAAAKLLRLHGVSRGLRTLDALQLAIALDMLEASSISVIVSADKRLCEVAEIRGCPAIDPAQPGLIQGLVRLVHGEPRPVDLPPSATY
jgi:hypothetical protein